MRIGQFHLTYCSNIHPGETWPDVRAALTTNLPLVRQALPADGPLAIGLRLSARAAEALEAAAELSAFRRFLEDGRYYVFTINGFPYGAFHGRRVKEDVYLPDWRDERRLEYSNRLARILASILPDDPSVVGTVSTVPGAFKREVRHRRDVERIASLLLRHAAELKALREVTGRTIMLALEPEPACFIETTAEAVAFFREYLFDATVRRQLGAALPVALDEEDVRRHLGLCYDACHMAVQFEEVADSVQAIQSAGITVGKIQLSSALQVAVPPDGGDVFARLAPFAEDTYLHQVVQRVGTDLTRFTDLPEALAEARDAAHPDGSEWRVHFHLPIYLDRVPSLETTHRQLEELLRLLKRNPFCPYLEVETYTWSVLTPELRTADLPAAIARELAWVRERLQ